MAVARVRIKRVDVKDWAGEEVQVGHGRLDDEDQVGKDDWVGDD